MSSKMILDAIGFVPAKGTSFGEALQDLAALSALTTFEDKQIRLVENEGLMFRFDLESFAVADGTNVIRPSTLASENGGRWLVLKPIVDHPTVSNLNADDHTQYVHKDIARLISAVHTFNPATAGAAFVLGANAVDQKIIGLNADKLDGLDSSAFVQAGTITNITVKHSFNPTVADAPFELGANAQGQKVIGLNADLLDGLDGSAFVQKSVAATITAAHTFSPLAVGVPFILSANAQGQKVIGLNADQLDGLDSTDFVQKTVAATITAVNTISPATATAPWILSANAQGQKVIGLNADQLDGLDSTALVQRTSSSTITAVHTLNPVAVGAPVILGANAVGQKVIGLNADQLDGLDSTDFVRSNLVGVANGIASLNANGRVPQSQMAALANGMPAYVESVSGVLISMTTIGVNFALVTGGTRNVYMNNLGDIPSNTMGFILPRNALLIAVVVAISTNAGNNTNASFQIRKNDSLTPLLSFPLLSGTSRRIFTAQSLSFNAGDEIQCYIAAGQNVSNPTMFLEFAWRD